jgi:hypothetical protein
MVGDGDIRGFLWLPILKFLDDGVFVGVRNGDAVASNDDEVRFCWDLGGVLTVEGDAYLSTMLLMYCGSRRRQKADSESCRPASARSGHASTRPV